MSENSYYNSTEIIIKSDSRCELLVEELMSDETAHYIIPSHDIGKWYICIAPTMGSNPEKSIESICASIENLTEEAQTEWKESIFKEFYIGYRISQDTPHIDGKLSHKIIQRIAKLGAGISIAMYPIQPDEAS